MNKAIDETLKLSNFFIALHLCFFNGNIAYKRVVTIVFNMEPMYLRSKTFFFSS